MTLHCFRLLASIGSAVLVVFLIGGGCSREADKPADSMETQDASKSPAAREFVIEGMSCQGCVDTVTDALNRIPGVQSVKVSLEEKKAIVVADETTIPSEKIQSVIVAAGYKAQPTQPIASPR